MDNNISVIIPFYNSIHTLGRLIDSILAGKTIPSEIILIDDGSTDSSLQLATSYATTHDFISVFSQEHSGVSAARNLGLSKVHGSWINFLDADDYIEPDMYSLMLAALTETSENYDGCVCGYFTHKDNILTPYVTSSKTPLSSKDLMKLMFTDDSIRGFLFTRLFSIDLLKDISFDENVSYCEDLLFQTRLFSSRQVAFSIVQKPLYHYVQNATSLTAAPKYFTNDIFIYKPAFDRIQKYYSDFCVTESYNSILEYSMYTLLKSYTTHKDNETLRQIKLLQKEMKQSPASARPKSKRRFLYETAPVFFSRFLRDH